MKRFWTPPGYGLTFAAGFSLVAGVFSLAGAVLIPPARILYAALALLYLTAGIGAWQRHIGAIRMGAWMFAIFAGLRLASLPIAFTLQKLLTGVLFALVSRDFFAYLRLYPEGVEDGGDDGGDEDDDEIGDDDGDECGKLLLSIALFLSKPRLLSGAVLAGIVEEAWGGDYTSGGDESGDGFVVGDDGDEVFLIQSPHGIFMVHNQPEPYWDELEEVAEGIGELRLQKIVLEHRAWLAVDLLTPHDPNPDKDYAYDLIIRLIVELADENDTLAIFRPETGQINVWHDDVFETLVRPGGLENFNNPVNVPVIPVADDDPEMLAAVAEARRRWPEFVQAFHRRSGDDAFTVKAPVSAGGNTEFIWIDVTELDADHVRGNLGNDPVDLGDLKLGDPVEIPIDSLQDWTVSTGDGEPVGLFSIEAIKKVEERLRTEREGRPQADMGPTPETPGGPAPF